MNIAQSIRALLEKEGRVVIPGLGIFETKYYSASLNKEKKRLSPPETRTVFIKKPDATDDQLINYVAESEKITKEESKAAIEDHVKSLLSKLKLAHKVNIEKIGYLIIRDKHLHFKPDTVNDLPELHVEPLHKKAEPEPVIPVKPAAPEEKKEKEEKKAAGFISYLAMPLLLLLIILSILIYIIVNPINTPVFRSQYSGHIPLSEYPTREVKVTKIEPVTKQAKVEEPEQKPEPEPEPEQETIIPTPRTGKYHIIVASLEYKTMAEVYANKLIKMGYPEAMIIGPARNGNYRVSMDSFKEKTQAMLHLMYARKLITNKAWLMKH